MTHYFIQLNNKENEFAGSFIIDALRDMEDDSPLETQESIDEWAEREALDLGLITK